MNYRSILFIPGNNPGMLQNSDILGADALFIDLEDAVALSEKDTARILVKEYLNTFRTKTDIFIRINPLDSPYFYDDLDSLKEVDVKGILLPKAGVESMVALDKYLDENNLDLEIIALIESALGLERAFEILQKSDKIVGMFLGAEDLTLDLGSKRTKASKEIDYARAKIIAAAKAMEIQAIDTPFTDTDDMEGLREDTLHAKDLGMTGKAIISPRHADLVNKLFSPSKEEIEYAYRVVEGVKDANEKGLGAFSIEGKMIDKPIILRALNTLKLSGEYKEEYDELLR
ncbi:MAG: HpcH/HpaI aldolase/citrate lyase family protein [Tissierella sp.]|uniref:HpcH/HpaI aldolase/citrate lyase family protein n=1 Tax=Tissierella sp. TaxID=41274 RepID=UPI003F96FA58